MEALELKYHEGEDGMYYPNLILEEETIQTLGKFGIMAMEYLKENHYPRFRCLVRTGLLNQKMKEVEEEANQMMESLMTTYLQKHRPEKPQSTMEMWKIREQGMRQAEEIVLYQIVNKYH